MMIVTLICIKGLVVVQFLYLGLWVFLNSLPTLEIFLMLKCVLVWMDVQ